MAWSTAAAAVFFSWQLLESESHGSPAAAATATAASQWLQFDNLVEWERVEVAAAALVMGVGCAVDHHFGIWLGYSLSVLQSSCAVSAGDFAGQLLVAVV
jgi:hypothetical protein